MKKYHNLEITKCKGRGCPIKDKCYRYIGENLKTQSYFLIEPFQYFDEGNTFSCAMFWGDNANQIFNKISTIVKNQS